MSLYDNPIKADERVVYTLRALYRRYGYRQYKMSKFEEYDLYVRNKDFLVSDHIITFTDTGGKLMALKPDVTLSIIKNSRDAGGVEKVYYNENVYRVAPGARSFREIVQVGLECLGDVDDYCLSEVILLAAESLRTVSDRWVLDLSHLGVVSAVVSALGLSDEGQRGVFKCIGEKNAHGISAICAAEGISAEQTAPLLTLVSTYGAPDEVIPALRALHLGDEAEAALNQLATVTAAIPDPALRANLRIDFSVVGNMRYYNGIVFKGFVDGIPTGILSGGQYGGLMNRMGKRGGAIGFAVYPDMLEELYRTEEEYDVDTVILYDGDADLKALNDTVRMLTENGKSVMAQRTMPEKLRCRQLLRFKERGVEIVENHA